MSLQTDFKTSCHQFGFKTLGVPPQMYFSTTSPQGFFLLVSRDSDVVIPQLNILVGIQ